MTKFEATNKLFVWFTENDSFCIEDDFKKVILLSESEERDLAAVELSLESLEKMEFISHKTINNKKYWILHKPISQFESNVAIPAQLGIAISESINEFCDIINDDRDKCDATDIKEKDIQNLLFMYNHAKKLVGESGLEEEG
tara:strand:+ start:3342 stop:3767 length:426 start_codon:yes stop_codon:yes gene_type:complete